MILTRSKNENKNECLCEVLPKARIRESESLCVVLAKITNVGVKECAWSSPETRMISRVSDHARSSHGTRVRMRVIMHIIIRNWNERVKEGQCMIISKN